MKSPCVVRSINVEGEGAGCGAVGEAGLAMSTPVDLCQLE